ncbi:MAG: hypothetical protein AAFY07_10605 [Pseudomonadota bacterium]
MIGDACRLRNWLVSRDASRVENASDGAASILASGITDPAAIQREYDGR